MAHFNFDKLWNIYDNDKSMVNRIETIIIIIVQSKDRWTATFWYDLDSGPGIWCQGMRRREKKKEILKFTQYELYPN